MYSDAERRELPSVLIDKLEQKNLLKEKDWVPSGIRTKLLGMLLAIKTERTPPARNTKTTARGKVASIQVTIMQEAFSLPLELQL